MKHVRNYNLPHEGKTYHIACYERTAPEEKYDRLEIDMGIVLKNIKPNSAEALKIVGSL